MEGLSVQDVTKLLREQDIPKLLLDTLAGKSHGSVSLSYCVVATIGICGARVC